MKAAEIFDPTLLRELDAHMKRAKAFDVLQAARQRSRDSEDANRKRLAQANRTYSDSVSKANDMERGRPAGAA